MENKPKLTVSGYRGIWGESLNNQIVLNYVEAFIRFIKNNIKSDPTILLGRDGRESGPLIKKTIINFLLKEGINFINGDILPTPTILFAVKKYKYDGAIIITASHNPKEYNGLKFVTNKALFTNEEEVQKIKEFLKNAKLEEVEELDLKKTNNQNENIIKDHVNHIINNINVDLIKSKKWKVAVDMINASACVVDPYLFEKLGVELIPLNNIPNGNFGHKPEPLRENLSDIANLVKEKRCDLGFAHDPDADRLVVINEKGEVVFEEYTLAFGVEAIMSRPENYGKNVVVNMSTSAMSKDIVEKCGGKCFKTKVGEANVVSGIIENNAIIGGEGGGGIIYPTINMARDSFVSLALILELLAKRNQTVSECIETLPKYEMMKDKVSINENINEIYKKMIDHFRDCEINELDGLRLDFTDGSWIHLRPSNTEPIVRLYGEAKTKERIEYLFSEVKNVIE